MKTDPVIAAPVEPRSKIDLAQPDASAEPLADILKTVQMNATFSRLVLFTWKWLLRPLVYWPIKFSILMVVRGAKAAVLTEEERRRRDEWQRHIDDEYLRRIINGE